MSCRCSAHTPSRSEVSLAVALHAHSARLKRTVFDAYPPDQSLPQKGWRFLEAYLLGALSHSEHPRKRKGSRPAIRCARHPGSHPET